MMRSSVSKIDAARMRTAHLQLVAQFKDTLPDALDVLTDLFGTDSSREVLTRWISLADDAKAEVGRVVGVHVIAKIGGRSS